MARIALNVPTELDLKIRDRAHQKRWSMNDTVVSILGKHFGLKIAPAKRGAPRKYPITPEQAINALRAIQRSKTK